jgi:hypothetical protein
VSVEPTNLGSKGEIVRAATTMPSLVRAIAQLGLRLDDVDNQSSQRRWIDVVRALHTVQSLGSLQFVAVSGAQGAGKTTLLQALYPSAEQWLDPNEGRGEKLPIAVVEVAGRSDPVGIATYLHQGKFSANEVPLTEWRQATRANRERLLSVRLEVPVSSGFWGVENAGFVLLPGFEQVEDEAWQRLMRLVLATSASVVIVTDLERIATASQKDILAELQGAADGTTGNQNPVDIVIGLNRCDHEEPRAIANAMKVASHATNVPLDAIVPFGAERDSPPSWPATFRKTVSTILPNPSRAQRQEVSALYDVVRGDVGDVIQLARTLHDHEIVTSSEANTLENFMEAYQSGCDRIFGRLRTNLSAELGKHASATEERLQAELQNAGYLKEAARRAFEYLGSNPDKKLKRLLSIVDAAWDRDAAGTAVNCATTETIEWFSRPRHDPEAKPDDFLPLLSIGDSLSDPRLKTAIQFLPGAVLAWHALAQQLPGAAGDRGEPLRTANVTGVREALELLGDRGRVLLTGAVASSPHGPPAHLSPNADQLVQPVLSMATSTKAGSATLVHPVIAVTAVVAVAAGASLRHANRAMSDRRTLAETLLADRRAETEGAMLDSVREALEFTRDRLRGRLSDALGIDQQQASQAGLQQSIAFARQIRSEMLETLSA